jgi:glutamate racemase
MPAMTAQPTILVFDSGLGGLTVFREVVKARPDARLVYAADDAFFPYGKQDEPLLIKRVLEVMGELIGTHRPDVVVVACNTASTIVLAPLREKFQVPFVGTVPAIKPACSASKTRLVTVLGTEATVKREYTRMLIREHGNGCWSVRRIWPSLPRPSSRARLCGTATLPPRFRPASSRRAACAPTPWCWPAPTIPCC